MVCEAIVPEWLAFTQPSAGRGDAPVCTSAPSAIAFSPLAGAEV